MLNYLIIIDVESIVEEKDKEISECTEGGRNKIRRNWTTQLRREINIFLRPFKLRSANYSLPPVPLKNTQNELLLKFFS